MPNVTSTRARIKAKRKAVRDQPQYTPEEEAYAQRVRETLGRMEPVEGRDFHRMPVQPLR